MQKYKAIKEMRIRQTIQIVLLCSIIGFTSCEYEVIKPLEYETGEVSFATDLTPVFKQCSGCHNGSVATELTYQSIINAGYINNTNPAESTLYTKCDHSMEVTAKEKALILSWIEQGAKDN